MMIEYETLLVTLVKLVGRLPPAKPRHDLRYTHVHVS